MSSTEHRKQQQREANARYYLKHREKIRAKSKERQPYNTKYAWLWSLKNEYKITVEDFDKMLISQCGKCATCSKELKKFHIDHDHASGRVRGLLCGQCNQALGLVKDSPEVLKSLAAYLENQ